MAHNEPLDAEASQLIGREFATAIVVFHEAVGRLLGLSAVERKCVDLLRQLGPVTAGTISERTGLTTGAVTRMVDRLSAAGYVSRVRDPDDRRKVVVQPVPNPRMDALMAMAFVPFGEDLGKVMAGYAEPEIRVILDWVRRTTDVLIANTRRVEQIDPATV